MSKQLIAEISASMKHTRVFGKEPDDMEENEKSVVCSWRNLGRWIHDEESGHEREEEGDSDWREDDDNMILAPGELNKINKEIMRVVSTKSWYPKIAGFNLETGEKSWLYLYIMLVHK